MTLPKVRVRVTPSAPVVRVKVAPGIRGLPGLDGEGVPAGGDAGQVLSKLSSSNYDTAWVDPVSTAEDVSFAPAGNLSSTTVQDALEELDAEKATAAQGALADSAVQPSAVRELLTANRTYYVRTDGSDSNTGLANTSGGAFLTIQKAINVATALDLSIYAVTIQLGAGTYSGAVTLASYVGAGPITIVGDETTPSNVIISRTGSCISGTGVLGQWRIRGMRLQTSGSGHAMVLTSCDVTFQNVDFGACAGGHIVATNASRVTATGNYSISGGASRHWWCEGKSLFIMATRTVTITGTPAFSVVFALAHMLSLIQCNAMTFSGSATGVRYDASTNGVILVAGAGATYLPGNSAGSTATGGQYV